RLSGSPALRLSGSPALRLSGSPALPLSRSPALPLSRSPALPLSRRAGGPVGPALVSPETAVPTEAWIHREVGSAGGRGDRSFDPRPGGAVVPQYSYRRGPSPMIRGRDAPRIALTAARDRVSRVGRSLLLFDRRKPAAWLREVMAARPRGRLPGRRAPLPP